MWPGKEICMKYSMSGNNNKTKVYVSVLINSNSHTYINHICKNF